MMWLLRVIAIIYLVSMTILIGTWLLALVSGKVRRGLIDDLPGRLRR